MLGERRQMSDLAERVERVRLLLVTMNDPFPTPRALLEPDSGPAPSRYVPCETCRRAGEIRVRAGWTLCLVCDGLGWKRREGEPAWDAYLELPLEEASQLPRASRARRELPPQLAEDTFLWERLRHSYDRHGSYTAVRHALDGLSLRRPQRALLVRRVLVDGESRYLSQRAGLELELGVLELALRVGRVRVPPWLIERTKADERRVTVAELAATGMGPGEIARRLGLSKRVVQRKLRGGGGMIPVRWRPAPGTGGADRTGSATPGTPSSP